MSFTRRTFLLGAGSGLSLLALAACTDETVAPTPTPSPTIAGEVPNPSSFVRSNWATDPYSRGATSYLGVGASPQARETLREPLLDRVFLAGEAISDDPGTIRGAIDSGAVAARRVLGVMGDDERVAVIGAGAAGAEAVRQLSLRGVDVVLIEARDRVGGRIDSRISAGEHAFELGAWQLADVADDELITRLDRADVEVLPLPVSTARVTAAAAEVVELPEPEESRAAVAATLTAAIDWAREQPNDLTIADAIEQSGRADDLDADGALLAQQLLVEFAALTGADADDQTSWFLAQLIGEQTSVPDGPMSAIIDSALDGIDPVLSTVVVAVFYDDDSVSLRLGTGESLKVDRVILTAPLGVLKEQAIEFDPVLPLLHRSALDELAVGHIEVLALEFDEPFWETDAVLWFLEDDDKAVRLWVNMVPITGQSILLGLVGGEAALAVSELDDDDLLAAAAESLIAFV